MQLECEAVKTATLLKMKISTLLMAYAFFTPRFKLQVYDLPSLTKQSRAHERRFKDHSDLLHYILNFKTSLTLLKPASV